MPASDLIEVTRIRFTPAAADTRRDGLLGWVSCIAAGQLQLDGIAVRRTRAGKYAISFPSRRDSRGNQHPYALPLGDRARHDFEKQILSALRMTEAVE